MSRLARASLWGVGFIVCAGASAFLISQGLSKAGLWATVVALPVAAIGAAAGVWSVVLAASAMRETRLDSGHSGRQNGVLGVEGTPEKEACVELVDASIDRNIKVDRADTPSPTKDQSGEYLISDVSFQHQAIDFKFINRGNVAAVLHHFTVEILDFQPDITPVFTCSVPLPFSGSPWSALNFEVNNQGLGDAVDFSAQLSDPILRDLFPDAKLRFRSPVVPSGKNTIFKLVAADADQQKLGESIARRKVLLTRAIAAESADPSVLTPILGDSSVLLGENFEKEFKIWLGTGRNWRETYAPWPKLDPDYDFLPIDLSMDVDFQDQKNNPYSMQLVPAFAIGKGSYVVGFGIGAEGFCYKYLTTIQARQLDSRQAYAVILDPRESREHSYSISRIVPPGGADRFHVIVDARQSGDFNLRLTFQVNRSAQVSSGAISISLKEPRDSQRAIMLRDGASFELHDGRLVLGENPTDHAWWLKETR